MREEKFPRLRKPFTTPSYIHKEEFKQNFKNCLMHHYIYVWLKNQEAFWMFPTKRTNKKLIGLMALRENIWKYREISFDMIDSIYA